MAKIIQFPKPKVFARAWRARGSQPSEKSFRFRNLLKPEFHGNGRYQTLLCGSCLQESSDHLMPSCETPLSIK